MSIGNVEKKEEEINSLKRKRFQTNLKEKKNCFIYWSGDIQQQSISDFKWYTESHVGRKKKINVAMVRIFIYQSQNRNGIHLKKKKQQQQK